MRLLGRARSQTSFSHRETMDDLKSPHYKLSKIVLSTIGLWPYDKSWLTKVKRVFVLAIMASSLTFLVRCFCFINFHIFLEISFRVFRNNFNLNSDMDRFSQPLDKEWMEF